MESQARKLTSILARHPNSAEALYLLGTWELARDGRMQLQRSGPASQVRLALASDRGKRAGPDWARAAR